MSPFEIMRQDKDDVIMLVNYYIEKGESEPAYGEPKQPTKSVKSSERIRVNDKTASGGWF